MTPTSKVEVERYVIRGEDLREIIRTGFRESTLLGGAPGSGQVLEWSFPPETDFLTVSVKVTTPR